MSIAVKQGGRIGMAKKEKPQPAENTSRPGPQTPETAKGPAQTRRSLRGLRTGAALYFRYFFNLYATAWTSIGFAKWSCMPHSKHF